MTDMKEERQSDGVVAERIRFACAELGTSTADGHDMARRAVAKRTKADTEKGGDD